MRKLRTFMASIAIAACGLATAAHSESVVKVTLIDKVGALDLSKSMGLGMAMHGDMKKAPMGININPKVVPSGNVKFNVTNLASAFMHEVIITRVKDENAALPFIADKNMLDQEALRTLGEVAEINPSKSASLTIEMPPGKYLLYCNLPGHFMAGMWTVIEVK